MCKEDRDLKIAIIGMGYLMEYIRPCYARMLETPERLYNQVRAVTMDERDLKAKNERLGFPVYFADNIGMLQEIMPDIILFSPPPEAAPALINDTLKPHFESCRKQGLRLPVIYAFPPSPEAQYYVDVLGEGTCTMNCIPSPTNDGSGRTLLSYPPHSAWSAAEIARLERFFSAIGGNLTLTPAAFYEYLGSICLFPPIYSMLFDLTDVLHSQGHSISHNQMQKYLLERYDTSGDFTPDTVPEDFPAGLPELLCRFVVVWADSIATFQTKSGYPGAQKEARETLAGYFRTGCTAAEAELKRLHRKYATRGGIAELVIIEYHRRISPLVRAFFTDFSNRGIEEATKGLLNVQLTTMCEAAARKSAALHLPFMQEEPFTEVHTSRLCKLLIYEAESLGEVALSTVKDALRDAGKDMTAPALFSSTSDILYTRLNKQDAEDIIGEARLRFATEYGQGMAFALSNPVAGVK